MTNRTKKLLVALAILALTLVIFTGSALAQSPADPETPDNGGWLGQMQSWMDEVHGPGSWGRMIARMTQVHGPETTGRMLQWMNETGGCHGDGESPMGSGFQGMRGRAWDTNR
jgi:hypothetical protein